METAALTLYVSVLILFNCAIASPNQLTSRHVKYLVPRRNAIFSQNTHPINLWRGSIKRYDSSQSKSSGRRFYEENRSMNDLMAQMMQRHNDILETNRHTLFLRRRVTEIPMSTLCAWTIELNASESKHKPADSADFLYIAEKYGENMKHRHFRVLDCSDTVQIRFNNGEGRDEQFYSDRGTLWLILNAKADMVWFSSDRSIKDIKSDDLWSDR